MVNKHRIRLLQNGNCKKGTVLYWMSRDQRVYDNWAFLFAQQLAEEKNSGLAVIFTLLPNFLEAPIRQYGFMLEGLKEVHSKLKKLNIPLLLLNGSPNITIPAFIEENDVSVLVADFDPLKIKRIWKHEVAKRISIPFYEVDAHNIVPCLYASDKEEFAAYTIRPKIQKLLPEFLDEFPPPSIMANNQFNNFNEFNLNAVKNSLKVDRSVKEINWCKPGEEAAIENLELFLQNKLPLYAEKRNNPVVEGQSNLSPYLHFGHISAQRIALNIRKHFPSTNSSKALLEELIVRRELADNFCYFNTMYDSFDGFKDWAKKSLNEHRNDKRDYIYTQTQFENAQTHEDLWNAAQQELIQKGKIHGYMRMYWAKKILEWSPSPEEALKSAIYLNDKYSLDGRDPNGYTGCAWSIGGIHDRAWAERPVFGKIRYMNYNGCKRKFDTAEYIKKNMPG